MNFSCEKENYVKEIYEKLDKVNYKDIDYREITTVDINTLNQDQVLRVTHPKGFNIEVQKEYVIELVLNIPTIMYGDNYIVSDPILGKHSVVYNAEDMAEYLNGLLGFVVD